MNKTLITAITLAYICTTYAGNITYTYAQFDNTLELWDSITEKMDKDPNEVISELKKQFDGIQFTNSECEAVSLTIQETNGISTVTGINPWNCELQNTTLTSDDIITNVINVITANPSIPLDWEEEESIPTTNTVTTPTPTTNTVTTPPTTTNTVTAPTPTTNTVTTPTPTTNTVTTPTPTTNTVTTPTPTTNTVTNNAEAKSTQIDSSKDNIISNLLNSKENNIATIQTVINNWIVWDSTVFLDHVLNPLDLEAWWAIDTKVFFAEVLNPALTTSIKQKIEGTEWVKSVKGLLDLLPESLVIETEDDANINDILKSLTEYTSVEFFPNITYVTKSEVWFTNQSVKNLNKDDTNSQWYLNFVHGDNESCGMWETKVNVAIVDNAFEPSHQDLDLNITKKYDVSDKDDDVNPIDPNNEVYNHGTVQAWIIGAEDNGEWVTWVSPHANLMLYKAGRDSAKEWTITDGITAIARAYQDGAEIINVSWGGFTDSPMLEKVTKKISETWVHIVAAAWNYNTDDKFYPAAYEHIIWVAALDESWKKAAFSNYGPWVDVAAPWVDMYTTDLNNSYASYSGTSESAPVVTAAIAVARSYGLDREDVRKSLASTPENGIGEWVVDLTFVCKTAQEIKRNLDLEEDNAIEHGTANDSKNNNNLLFWWWILILLGLIGIFASYILHKRES